MKKKVSAMALTLALSMSLVGTAFASDSSTESSTSSQVGLTTVTPTTSSDTPITPYFAWSTVTNDGYLGYSYGSWVNGVSGPGPGTLSLSKTVSISNTYSGTLSAKVDDITAAVGFSITKLNSTTASYSIPVPQGKSYMIRYRAVYNKYKCTQYNYDTDPISGWTSNLGTTTIYPMQYDHLEYDYITL